MKTQRQRIADSTELPRDIADRLPGDIRKTPEALTMAKERTQLNSDLAAVNGRLNGLVEGPTGTQRQALLHSREELAAEIRKLSERLVSAEVAAARIACRDLQPTAQALMEDVWGAMIDLDYVIRVLARFFDELDRRGIVAGIRPEFWGVCETERNMIFGGGGIPSLLEYVRQRRAIWSSAKSKR